MGIIREAGRLFIFLGVMFVALGVVLYFGAKLPFRLGQLPGDIVYRTKNGLFYFPIVSCLLLSAIVTVLAWLAAHIRR
ncbi:MAG TPA: DUF2905 domain-containing protein [Candidatus Acidoferrales bacterium]|nr:DUF2905 domain-containing protein [Candidatus Acidoferrales bacterium]